MSVTIPLVDEFGTSWYKTVWAVSIPILWDPDKPLIAVVLKPDITTLSLSFRLGAVEIYADTWLGSLQTKIVFSKVSIVVTIELISFPDTLFTDTLKPPPFVPVLSNIAESPTS